jgi:hypothetical protein
MSSHLFMQMQQRSHAMMKSILALHSLQLQIGPNVTLLVCPPQLLAWFLKLR